MAFVWADWNISSGAERVVLAQVNFYDVSESLADILYFGSEVYYDSVNDNIYENTIVDVPTLFFGTTSAEPGPVNVGIGNLIISNIDERYDDLFDDSFYGRTIEFFVGPRGNDFADYQSVFKGQINNVVWESGRTISFEVRDFLDKLNRPAQRNRFSSGGNMPTDMVDEIIPWGFGKIKQVTPVIVHDTDWLYQVSDGIVHDVMLNISADGVGIGATVDTEDHTNAQIGLNAEPTGEVTVNFHGDKPSGTLLEEMGDVLEEILTRDDEDGVSILEAADVNSTAITNLNSDCTLNVEVWINDDIYVIDLFQKLMPYGYLWGFNRAGEFVAQTLKDPSGETATETLDQSDILRNGLTVLEEVRPAWRVNCRYQKNYSVITNFTTGASKANRATMSRKFRKRDKKSDSSIKTTHKNARRLIYDLQASGGVGGASEEVARVFDLFSVRRRVYQVQCWAKPLSFEIGDIVTVTFPRYNLDAGVDLVFIGAENKLNSGIVTAYFWG